VHLILHRFEKLNTLRLGWVVIDAGRVDVCNLLIKAALGCADVLNPPEQLIEVVKGLIGIF